MRYSTVVAFLGSMASLAMAATVPSSVMSKRQSNPGPADAQGHCQGAVMKNNNFIYLVVAWTEHGTIDPGTGDPGIDNTASVWLFNINCEEIGAAGWNGGRGSISVDMSNALDADWALSMYWGLNLISNDRPVPPTDLQWVIDGTQASGDLTDGSLVCDDGFSNSGFGFATYWRVCFLSLACDTCLEITK